jgi:7-carboxy-7-deazaguanine synthase
MTLNQVIDSVEQFRCPRLTLTGGEPLLQKEAQNLVSLLIDSGYAVSVETNGSIPITGLDPRCIKVVDLKCPSSGMQGHNCMENIPVLGPKDQIKFVIANESDFEFALSMSKQCAAYIDPERILFSPVYGVLPAEQLASWMLESKAGACMQIQLHKFLWPDRDRGV